MTIRLPVVFPSGSRWASESFLAVLIGLIWLWLLLVVVYPLGHVLVASISDKGQLAVGHFAYLLSLPYYRRVLLNSIVLATIVASTGTAVSLAYALATTRVAIPGRQVFHLLALLPTITPPFVFGLSIIMLLGRRGLLTHAALGLSSGAIYGLPGLIIAQVLGFFPFAYLLLRSLLLGLNPAVEEAAMTLGADRMKVVRTVILPLLAAGIGGAFLLLFIYSMTDLGNPIVIGGDFGVVPAQIYLTIIGRYNVPQGTALAILLLVPAMLLFLAQKALERRSTFATITGRPTHAIADITEPRVVMAATAFCTVVSAAILAIYLSLLAGSLARLWGVDYRPTLEHFRAIFGPNTLGFQALRDTLLLALVASVLTGVLGLVAGYLIQRVPFPGRNLMDLLSTLPLAVPGIVTGIGFAIAFNKPPVVLAGTAAIIILIFIVRTLPYGLRAAVAAIAQIERDIDDASLVLGGGRAQTFWRIIFPLVRPAFLAAIIYNFTRNITTLSAVIFVVSARWKLITAAMLAEVDAGRVSRAAAFGVFLISLVVLLNLFLYRYVEKEGVTGKLAA